ncbi:hypothetical protein SAMN00808754_1440 [Thermanaeromonas toyohensis ToBE]|uniref:Uncharacterized protein n=1 Tax=Thermanaeromonas toyohensis ToBE TaxID=698762 RepID=A0A1W1VT50_9FIRM|nr:hypothetical protein [Thermanaeromonas toyohensis]SMB96281.1 hypothetical protein SAMN00808754_1440 [Thermanaeromonas toyohensis ToBE]
MKKNVRNVEEIETNGEDRSFKSFSFSDLLYFGRGTLMLEILADIFLLALILAAYFTGHLPR